MHRPIVFGLLVLLVAPLGGGQLKAGEFPQGAGKATSGGEGASAPADQLEPSTSREIFPRTKKIFGWLTKSGVENGPVAEVPTRPVPATRAVPIAASTSGASETTVDAGSSPVGDWLSGSSRPGMPASATTSARNPRVDSPVGAPRQPPVNLNRRWVRALLLQCPPQACRVMSYPRSAGSRSACKQPCTGL